MSVQTWLEGIWYRGRAGALLLAPLSVLFAAGSAVRRALYARGWRRPYRAAVPVVVIGNLTVGGTGKTPLVAALADSLQRRGLRIGILLRGYGATVSAPQRVTRETDAAAVGDEACLLASLSNACVLVSPDRIAGARELERQGVDLILCDDGLQHYALAREVEIAVIDGRRGLGNGRLLPAGPLRERPSRLEQVDFVVVNTTAMERALEAEPWAQSLPREKMLTLQLVPEAARRLDDPRQWRSLDRFRDAPVHAVAAIGHPERFFAMLRAAGLQIIEHPFADHHAFTSADLDFGDAHPVLMTGKDAVKCRSFADGRLWELPVATKLAPEGGAMLIDTLVGLSRKESR